MILKKFRICLAGAFLASFLAGCGSVEVSMPFDTDMSVSNYNVNSNIISIGRASPFAEELCVVEGNVTDPGVQDTLCQGPEGLFDVENRKAVYASGVHDRIYPASTTKVMTALVALKNASPDRLLTAGSSVQIKESGATKLGIKEGDTMTLDQALRVLLLYSANDVAMLIADNIGGGVDNFVEMMNREALALGASNTHFTNPHGLNDPDHYTTAYDMYLIFNGAIKFDLFNEIISMEEYSSSYLDRTGTEKKYTVKNTGFYKNGKRAVPEGITVIGGKTGTTQAAGNCLVMISENDAGKSFISMVFKADSTDDLYHDMDMMLRTAAK